MFKVKDIVKICNGSLLQGNNDAQINNFCNDTRIIKSTDTYVGIKGNKYDGNLFCKDAILKGVKICILEHMVDELNKYTDVTIILVKDSIKALQDLARYKINNFKGKVIAITGSVGKTSTKDIIYSVVSTKYKALRTIGNNNNHLGLPLTILKQTDEEVMILEMGMNNFNEIKLLSSIAKPDIAIITNVGTAHIGILGSRENILKAKLEILEGLKKDGKFIINNDNDLLHEYYEEHKNNNIITIGIDNKAKYLASNIIYEENYTKFKINNDEIILKIASKSFIYNALIAYAVGKELEINNDLIIKGINNFTLTQNRLEIKENKNGVIIIDDTYNASYDSVKASLELLKLKKGNKKIVVLGDILELGTFSKSIHESLAPLIINNNIDYLLLVGNEVNYLYKILKEKKYDKEIYIVNKYDETYKILDNILKKDDVVLLKASHAINLTEVVNYLMN